MSWSNEKSYCKKCGKATTHHKVYHDGQQGNNLTPYTQECGTCKSKKRGVKPSIDSSQHN